MFVEHIKIFLITIITIYVEPQFLPIKDLSVSTGWKDTIFLCTSFSKMFV